MWILLITNIIIFAGFCFLLRKRPMEALVLLPFAIAVMALSVLAYYDGEPEPVGYFILIFTVILIPASLFLIRGAALTNQLELPWYGVLASVLFTLTKYVLLLAVFILLFNFLSPILFIIFLVAMYQFTQAQKYGMAMDIISTIGTSIRQSMPLPTAMKTAAYGQEWRTARVFNRIANWLSQGYLLTDAIKRGYPKCPADILASIRAAEQMGHLPDAIESLQGELAEKINDHKVVKPVHPWYPLVVITWAFMIFMGLAVFIVPTFAEVLYNMTDGEATLPASTQSLLDLSYWLTDNNGLNSLLIIAGTFWIIPTAIYIQFRKRKPENPQFLSRIGDRIKWTIPVMHWFEKTYSNLHLVQILHTGLKAGYPVNTILRNALGLDINLCYRSRIKKWLTKIESGQDISQSARSCGMDKQLCWALDEHVNKSNAPDILRGLEQVYLNNYNYRKNVLASASWPFVILGLGLIVGYIVYGMFMGAFSILFATLQYTIPQ